MIERLSARRGSYRDSVTLMLASNDATRLDGVVEASAVAATPLNLELLERAGFDLVELGLLEPSDLVVAIRAESEQVVEQASDAIEARLAAAEPAETGSPVRLARSLSGAALRTEGTNLAVISVPGAAAAYECATAIEAGLHVFCFSSGFDMSLERGLKQRAADCGLLLMGPDCGTAILDGVGIGFANQLGRGPVGIVGASGTGMQQIGCLLDGAGIGISHAIGVGGRDLQAEIGGTMTLAALRLLGGDPATEVIVVVAKAPAPSLAARVADQAAATGKPVVLCFPGLEDFEPPAGTELATTLEAAARSAAEHAGGSLELAEPPVPSVPPGLIRGLFSGGTLRDEALAVITSWSAEHGLEPPLASSDEASDGGGGRHILVDYGSERLTLGRAHPMIDPALRNAAVARIGSEPTVAVLLVDVVLGRGSHPDPAGALAPAIESALGSRGGDLAVVVSLCGAAGDGQGVELQAARLCAAGATVARSNAAAARLALAAAGGRALAGRGPR